MNFLYISESPHPVLGGASKCIYTLFSSLVKRGHVCYTIGPSNEEFVFDTQGITVLHTYSMKPRFVQLLQEGINVVVTQLQGIDWIIELCTQYKVPVILRVPSFEYVCLDLNRMRNCGTVCVQNRSCTAKGTLHKTFRAGQVTACSKFASNIVQSIYGVPCTPIYPFIDSQDHLVPVTGDRITMIQGTEPKGLDIFLSIVDKLPMYNYLIVGQLRENTTLPPNVTYLPPTEDMKQVWQETKILLVPSLVQETFGRVAVEAELNGIPVVASNRGGLPEAVCSTFCYDPAALDSWISEISTLMNNPVYYQIRSIQVKEYIEKFSLEGQVSLFLQLVYRIQYPDLPIIDPSVKISILTSSYSSVNYLKSYFENLRSQMYINFEVILTLNDPSPEEEMIVSEYIKYFDIRVLRVPLESVEDTYNRAFKLAQGDLLLVAAVDDLIREDMLQRYAAAFKNDPSISVIYCDHVRKEPNGDLIKGPSSDFNIDLLKKVFYLGPHVAISKDVITDGNLLDGNYAYASDYEYYLRLAVKGYKFHRIPLPLSTYLERSDSITYTFRQEQIETTVRIQKEYQ